MTQPPPPPSDPWGPPDPGGYPGPKRGFARWTIGAVALVAVIAGTAVVAVSCTKSNGVSDKPTAAPTTSGAPTSDFASASDTGPVSVITEDPSCAPLMPILTTYANSQPTGWLQRDPAIPAVAWGPQLRADYEAAGKAMQDAADRMVPLIKLTNHRVMRELYEQFGAYARTYADRTFNYTPADDQLARAAVGAGEVLSQICQAASTGSAAARAPLLEQTDPPTTASSLGDPSEPKRFLSEENPVCSDWKATLDQYDQDPKVVAWVSTDSNPPATQWPPEQKAANEAVVPLMRDLADKLEKLGRESANPTFEDFATLASQYQRAFVNAIPTYSQPDIHLYKIALLTPGIILGGCNTAGI